MKAIVITLLTLLLSSVAVAQLQSVAVPAGTYTSVSSYGQTVVAVNRNTSQYVKSTDGGTTLAATTFISQMSSPEGVLVEDDLRYWVVGRGGTPLRGVLITTVDGGASWYEVPFIQIGFSFTTFTSVSRVGGELIVVGLTGGTNPASVLLRSPDNGILWPLRSQFASPYFKFRAVSSNTWWLWGRGFATSVNLVNGMWRNEFDTSYVVSGASFGAGRGYLTAQVDTVGHVYTTSDSGWNWFSRTVWSKRYPVALAQISATELYVSLVDTSRHTYAVLHSSDAGVTWDTAFVTPQPVSQLVVVGNRILGFSSGTAYAYTPGSPLTNRAPIWISTPPIADMAYVATSYRRILLATDLDGDVVRYGKGQGPRALTVDSTTGIVSWTPALADTGSHTVTVLASDYPNSGGIGYSYTIFVPTPRRPVIDSVVYYPRNPVAGDTGYVTIFARCFIAKSLTFGAIFADGTSAPMVTVTGPGAGQQFSWSFRKAYTTAGIYTITATVSDSLGVSAFATKVVTVLSRLNQQPVIDIFDIQPSILVSRDTVAVTVGDSISVTVGGHDADGTFGRFRLLDEATGITIGLSDRWSANRGGFFSVQFQYRYLVASTHRLTLMLTDSAGATTQRSKVVVVVSPRNPGPVIDSVVVVGNKVVGQPLTFTCFAHDSNGITVTLYGVWDDGSGPSVVTRTAVGIGKQVSAQFNHAYTQPGSYTVTFTAVDVDGLSHSRTLIVIIAPLRNQGPRITNIRGPATVKVGTIFDLYITAADSDGVQLGFLVDWSNGSAQLSVIAPGVGQLVETRFQNSYNSPGNKSVRITVTDAGGAVAVEFWTVYVSPLTEVEELGGIPTEFALLQNYPNPFNPSTSIEYRLPKSALVSIKVYNMLGVEVATLMDGEQSAGTYRVRFKSEGLSSGQYIYRLRAGEFVQVKKMLLLK